MNSCTVQGGMKYETGIPLGGSEIIALSIEVEKCRGLMTTKLSRVVYTIFALLFFSDDGFYTPNELTDSKELLRGLHSDHA